MNCSHILSLPELIYNLLDLPWYQVVQVIHQVQVCPSVQKVQEVRAVHHFQVLPEVQAVQALPVLP